MTTPAPKKLVQKQKPDLNGPHRRHSPRQSGNHAPETSAFTPPSRRNSFWPFLLDLGVVMMLVSWIILKIGPLVVVGGFLAVIALVGWFRDARTEFNNLAD